MECVTSEFDENEENVYEESKMVIMCNHSDVDSVMAAIVMGAAAAATGRNYPLGITGGWGAIGKTIVTGQSAIAWEALLIIGIVIGAALAAIIAKEFKIRSPKPLVLVQTFFGGALMGFGAVTSTGCNVGHILSGVPQLSIGSIVGGLFIILGGWTAAYFLFIRTGKI